MWIFGSLYAKLKKVTLPYNSILEIEASLKAVYRTAHPIPFIDYYCAIAAAGQNEEYTNGIHSLTITTPIESPRLHSIKENARCRICGRPDTRLPGSYFFRVSPTPPALRAPPPPAMGGGSKGRYLPSGGGEPPCRGGRVRVPSLWLTL